MREEVTAGARQAVLANAISDALHNALVSGLQPDEATCIAVSVAADYARGSYGAPYLTRLADVLIRRGDLPVPPALGPVQ